MKRRNNLNIRLRFVVSALDQREGVELLGMSQSDHEEDIRRKIEVFTEDHLKRDVGD